MRKETHALMMKNRERSVEKKIMKRSSDRVKRGEFDLGFNEDVKQ
jgi:hypothetical protein